MRFSDTGNFRDWDFVADMNRDGFITISDVWLWCKWLFSYPGDAVLTVLIGSPFGDFFELSIAHFGGGFSFAVSMVLWVVVGATVASVVEELLQRDGKASH